MSILVFVDDSEVHALTREATRSLTSQQPRMMKRILDGAAAKAAQNHPYQNRTGDLTRSTVAGEIIDTGNDITVQVEASMEYASYVDNRGLMTLHERLGEAAGELEYYFDGEAERLGSL